MESQKKIKGKIGFSFYETKTTDEGNSFAPNVTSRFSPISSFRVVCFDFIDFIIYYFYGVLSLVLGIRWYINIRQTRLFIYI